MIESQTLSSRGEDSSSGRLGESQGGDGELGALVESDVVGDGCDADDG